MCKKMFLLIIVALALAVSGTVYGALPVTSGLILHLDANDIDGDDAADSIPDGNLITTWDDKSTGDNDAVAGTAPTYRTGIINGLPVVRFHDSNSEYLDLAGLTSSAGNYTFFVAHTCTSLDVAGFFFDTQTGRLLIQSDSDDGVRYYDGDSHVIAAATTGDQVLTYVLDSSGTEVFRDGTSLGTGTYSQKAIGDAVKLGSNYTGGGAHWNGDLGEIIIYDRALSSSEIDDMEDYLIAKWLGVAPEFITVDIPGPPSATRDCDASTNTAAIGETELSGRRDDTFYQTAVTNWVIPANTGDTLAQIAAKCETQYDTYVEDKLHSVDINSTTFQKYKYVYPADYYNNPAPVTINAKRYVITADVNTSSDRRTLVAYHLNYDKEMPAETNAVVFQINGHFTTGNPCRNAIGLDEYGAYSGSVLGKLAILGIPVISYDDSRNNVSTPGDLGESSASNHDREGAYHTLEDLKAIDQALLQSFTSVHGLGLSGGSERLYHYMAMEPSNLKSAYIAGWCLPYWTRGDSKWDDASPFGMVPDMNTNDDSIELYVTSADMALIGINNGIDVVFAHNKKEGGRSKGGWVYEIEPNIAIFTSDYEVRGGDLDLDGDSDSGRELCHEYDLADLMAFWGGSIDDSATAEAAVSGTVSGTFGLTRDTNDTYESITEVNTTYSYLEHKWTFDVDACYESAVTFYIEAYRTSNSEGDDFVFAYSTDGSNWTDMLTVSKTSDDDAYQSCDLPAGTRNTVYVRVRDADRTSGNTTNDTIYIDHMYFKSFVANRAWNPTPADNATGQDPDVDLSWSEGAYVADTNSHDVYFGTSSSGVADANSSSSYYKARQDSNSYEPGSMSQGTSYYWRIDEVNVSEIAQWAGNVWSFTILDVPGQASEPSPPDSATDCLTTVLGWTADADATSHDVYFGTSESDVNDANTSSAAFQVNQSGTSYDTSDSNQNTTFYWRIDEKNSAGTTKGNVWSFTTAAISLNGLILYLDANDIDGDYTADSYSDGASITTWEDKSGQNHDATSGSNTTYKVNIIGGMPVVRFTAGKFTLPTLNASASNYTFFWALTKTSAGPGWLFDSQTGRLGIVATSADGYGYHDGSWHEGVAAWDDGDQVLTWVFDSTNGFELFRNGTSKATDTYSQKALGGDTYLSANYLGTTEATLDIGEFVIYNRALSSSEVNDVETQLMGKYGL